MGEAGLFAIMVVLIGGGLAIAQSGEPKGPYGLDPTLVAPSPFAVSNPDWVEPVAPFKVIGPITYVGTSGIASFLIETEEGLILLDTGMAEAVPGLLERVETLGHALSDIKIILNSHAHFDHTAGNAAVKSVTGASLFVHEGDVSAVEDGVYLGSEDWELAKMPPATVDRVLSDGDMVTLGEITLTAHHTPGHTRGCTSWQMTADEAGQSYDVLFFCSASVAANRLVPDPQYPGIVDAYRHTFEKTADWRPDVFLSNHPFFFAMEPKRRAAAAGDPLAFVAPEAFPRFIAQTKEAFERSLEAQEQAAAE